MPAAIARGAALFAAVGLCAIAGSAQAPPRRVVEVSAERFAFTPSEIVVEPGEEIELRLTSDDTAHGFRIARTNVSLVIPKRGHKEVSAIVKIDEPGRYEFECTRMCGAGHHFMRGVVIVRARGQQ